MNTTVKPSTMNGHLAALIAEASELIAATAEAAERLVVAVEVESTGRNAAKAITEAYENAEAEILAGEMVGKVGIFEGLAATSKAYDAAYKARRSQVRSNELRHIAADVDRLKTAAEDAAADLRKAEVRFSAVKHAADLMAAILHASI